MGHLPSVCRSRNKDVNQMEDDTRSNINAARNDDSDPSEHIYDINLFVINSSKNLPKQKLKSNLKSDFSVQVIINNRLIKVLADTGAKVSVCSTAQAQKWGILNRATKTNKRTHTVAILYLYSVQPDVLSHSVKTPYRLNGTSFQVHVIPYCQEQLHVNLA